MTVEVKAKAKSTEHELMDLLAEASATFRAGGESLIENVEDSKSRQKLQCLLAREFTEFDSYLNSIHTRYKEAMKT